MREFSRTWRTELLCAAAWIAIVPNLAAYIGWLERRFAQGPALAQVGVENPRGVFSPITDALRDLGEKEAPPKAGLDGVLARLAPVFVFAVSMMALSPLAVRPGFWIVRDSNIGILFTASVAALGSLGLLVGRWAVAGRETQAVLRTSSTIASFAVVTGLALVAVLLLAGSLRVGEIVEAQRQLNVWFVFLTPAAFLLYGVATMVASHRAPFHLFDSERLHGFRPSLYRLADHVNMILIAAVATTLFWGGWVRPFASVHWMNWLDAIPAGIVGGFAVLAMVRAGKLTRPSTAIPLWIAAAAGVALAAVLALTAFHGPMRFLQAGLHGLFWFWLKTAIYVVLFTWLRANLPRFDFEQLMQWCWTICIPLALAAVITTAGATVACTEFAWNRSLAYGISDLTLLCFAIFLIRKKRVSARGIPVAESTMDRPDSSAYAG